MKYKIILSLFVFVTLIAGCKEDTGSFTINFIGTYDGGALVLGQDLNYTQDYDIQLLESDFYISEIALTKGSEVIEIKDVDYVDFTNNNFNLEKALAGINLSYSEIPIGTYDGIRFGIGVPPAVNSTLPSEYVSSNPLSKPGYYWIAWDSYIFAKFEGKVGDNGFFFHTGTDNLFRTLEISKEIVISSDNASSIKVRLDHKKLMTENGGLYDLQNNLVNHDPTALGPLEMFVNNYSSAFSFE